jgi:hypothetical protein
MQGIWTSSPHLGQGVRGVCVCVCVCVCYIPLSNESLQNFSTETVQEFSTSGQHKSHYPYLGQKTKFRQPQVSSVKSLSLSLLPFLSSSTTTNSHISISWIPSSL